MSHSVPNDTPKMTPPPYPGRNSSSSNSGGYHPPDHVSATGGRGNHRSGPPRRHSGGRHHPPPPLHSSISSSSSSSWNHRDFHGNSSSSSSAGGGRYNTPHSTAPPPPHHHHHHHSSSTSSYHNDAVTTEGRTAATTSGSTTTSSYSELALVDPAQLLLSASSSPKVTLSSSSLLPTHHHHSDVSSRVLTSSSTSTSSHHHHNSNRHGEISSYASMNQPIHYHNYDPPKYHHRSTVVERSCLTSAQQERRRLLLLEASATAPTATDTLIPTQQQQQHTTPSYAEYPPPLRTATSTGRTRLDAPLPTTRLQRPPDYRGGTRRPEEYSTATTITARPPINATNQTLWNPHSHSNNPNNSSNNINNNRHDHPTTQNTIIVSQIPEPPKRVRDVDSGSEGEIMSDTELSPRPPVTMVAASSSRSSPPPPTSMPPPHLDSYEKSDAARSQERPLLSLSSYQSSFDDRPPPRNQNRLEPTKTTTTARMMNSMYDDDSNNDMAPPSRNHHHHHRDNNALPSQPTTATARTEYTTAAAAAAMIDTHSTTPRTTTTATTTTTQYYNAMPSTTRRSLGVLPPPSSSGSGGGPYSTNHNSNSSIERDRELPMVRSDYETYNTDDTAVYRANRHHERFSSMDEIHPRNAPSRTDHMDEYSSRPSYPHRGRNDPTLRFEPPPKQEMRPPVSHTLHDSLTDRHHSYDHPATTKATTTSTSSSLEAAAVYPSPQELYEQKYRDDRVFTSTSSSSLPPLPLPQHRSSTMTMSTGYRTEDDHQPTDTLLGRNLRNDLVSLDREISSNTMSSQGRGRGRGSFPVSDRRNGPADRLGSGGGDNIHTISTSSNEYAYRRAMEEMDVFSNSDRGNVGRRDDDTMFMDRNSEVRTIHNNSNDFARGRNHINTYTDFDHNSAGGRGRGRGGRGEMGFGRGRGRETPSYGWEVSGRGIGRQTPPLNSLRISDPNPLNAQPYRGGPSPVNDHDHRHVDTRSSYHSMANSSGQSSKSPRELYTTGHNSASYHRFNGGESTGRSSPYSKRDYIGSSNNKFVSMQQQQQQQRRRRSTPTPTHDQDESQRLEDQDWMIIDESARIDLSKTDQVPSAVAENVPPTLSSSLTSPPPIVVVPPDVTSTEPSGLTAALLRLADLETQMEYEYAKHQQLAFQQKMLRAEYKVLESMPIGMAAYQSEYDQYLATLEPTKEEEPAVTVT